MVLLNNKIELVIAFKTATIQYAKLNNDNLAFNNKGLNEQRGKQMEKLSRNNKLGREKSQSELQHHYSFRKLNSGLLVSAAIGAFLFFDNNTVQAADTSFSTDTVAAAHDKNSTSDEELTSQDIHQKEVTLPKADTNNTPASSDENKVEAKNTDSTATTDKPASHDVVTGAKEEPKAVQSKIDTQKFATDHKASDKEKVIEANLNLAEKASSKAVLLASENNTESVKSKDGTATLSMDNNQVGNVGKDANNTIKLTLNISTSSPDPEKPTISNDQHDKDIADNNTEHKDNTISQNNIQKNSSVTKQVKHPMPVYHKKQALPQTGNRENNTLFLILGLGSVFGALISGAWASKKKKDN